MTSMQIGKGARIRLLHTDDRYTKLRPGDEGTITEITVLPDQLGGQRQIWVERDSGSSLALIDGQDDYEYWWAYRGRQN